jgi:hypothetical protein
MRPQGFGGAAGGASLEDLGWDDMGFEPPKPAAAPARDSQHDAFGEQLPDGPVAHPTGLTPVHSPVNSPVHDQQAQIADHFTVQNDEDVDEDVDETAEPYEPEVEEAAEPYEPDAEETAEPAPVAVVPTPTPAPVKTWAPTTTPAACAAPGTKGKAAFTLRLDRDRHLKLRLACAVNGRSAQQLVTDALDQLLTDMPELDAMAVKAKRKG